MGTQDYIKQYDYGNTEYQIALLPFLMLGISYPLIATNIIVLLIRIYSSSVSMKQLTYLPMLIISFVLVTCLCFAIINQHNKIRVTANGLLVRVFSLRFYYWIELPWEAILSIELAKRPDRWWKPLWLIEVSRLTPWHKFLGYMFHTGKHPVILLSSDMSNREDLLDVIKEHTNIR